MMTHVHPTRTWCILLTRFMTRYAWHFLFFLLQYVLCRSLSGRLSFIFTQSTSYYNKRVIHRFASSLRRYCIELLDGDIRILEQTGITKKKGSVSYYVDSKHDAACAIWRFSFPTFNRPWTHLLHSLWIALHLAAILQSRLVPNASVRSCHTHYSFRQHIPSNPLWLNGFALPHIHDLPVPPMNVNIISSLLISSPSNIPASPSSLI